MTYEELKAAHQAIIDAWFAAWLERQQAHAEAAFRRTSREMAKDRISD